jgi:hypothetical protein
VNRDEAARLLALVAQLDNRQVADATVELWARMFAHVDPADAANAVKAHFESSTDYLMPVHILRGVATIAAQRGELRRAALPDDGPRALPVGELLPAAPGDDRRGVRIVNLVLAGLGQARKQQGRLGRDEAAELGARLVEQALDRWPGSTPPRRGQSCGRATCRCLHERDPETGLLCDGGWIEVPARRRDQPTLFGGARPAPDPDAGRVKICPACDPVGAEMVSKAPGRRAALAALRQRR